MGNFSWKRDFKYVMWKETLLLLVMRAVSAGVVFAILALAGVGAKGANPFILLVGAPLIILIIILPLNIICLFLGSLGIPLMGLVGFASSLFVVFGDPLLWIVDKISKKGIIPVKKFYPINFHLLIFALREEGLRRAEDSNEQDKKQELKVEKNKWEGKLVVETTTKLLGFDMPSNETVLEIDAEGNVLAGIKIIGFVTPKGELYENLGGGIKKSSGKPLFGDKPLGYIAGGTWYSPKGEKIGKWWKEFKTEKIIKDIGL